MDETTKRSDPGHRVTPPGHVRAAHAARPAVRPGRVAAAAAAAGLGVAALLAVIDDAGPAASTPVSARLITATPQVPLPAADGIAVAEDCGADRAGLIADTTVRRP